MYLNQIKLWIIRILSLIGMIAFTLFGLMFLIYLLTFLDGFNEDRTTTDLMMTGLFMAMITLLLKWLFCLFRDTLRASRINKLLETDDDGLIPIKEAAEALRMKQSKFFTLFHRYVGKGWLVKCTVFSEDPTYIILDNGRADIRQKFTVCQCPNCGAPSTLRIGFEFHCKYCNSQLLMNAGQVK